MPRVYWDDINAASDPLPGRTPPRIAPGPEKAPTVMETLDAALRQTNIVTNVSDDTGLLGATTDAIQLFAGDSSQYQHYLQPNLYDPETVAAQPAVPDNYDALDDIAGFEEYADHFFRSGSPAQTQQIKGRITQELREKDVLRRAGGWGLAASVSSGIIDPVTLASMAIPVAAPVAFGSRATRVGLAVASQMTLDSATELALHQTQELRTTGDSIMNIGAGALLTGAFGVLATRVPKSEFDLMREQVRKDLKTPQDPQSLGAMRVGGGTTLEDEGIAKGGNFIAKTLGRFNPLNVLMRSSTKDARILTQELAEVPYLLNKNVEKGLPTALSAETRIDQRSMQSRAEVITSFDEAYAAYAKRVTTDRLSQRAFGNEVSHAMRRNDISAIPEAQSLAVKTRKLFETDKKTFQELGVLPEDIDLLGAQSYFPRVYDHAAIAANEIDFKNRLRKWYTENPKGQREAEEATAERQAAEEAVKPAVEAHTTAKGEHVESAKDIIANRAERKDAVRKLQRAERKTDDLDQTLQELEAQRAHLEDDMSGTEPKVLKAHADRLDAQIERLRMRGTKYEEIRAAHEQRVLQSEIQAEKLKTKAKAAAKKVRAAEQAADKAKAAHSEAKAVEKKAAEAATPRDIAEIDRAVAETVDRIMGTVRGVADLGHISNPKPLKTRVLDVPDEILEPYLVSDFEHTMNGYIRSVAPQIEFRRAFGSTDLAQEIEKISDAYHVKAQAIEAGDGAVKAKNEKLTKLRAEQAKVTKNILGIRDRLLNQVGPRGNDSINWVRAGRIVRAYNYVTKLGAQTISSFSDYGHVMSRYGLVRTGRMTAKFLTNFAANKLIREDAKRMGTALDWIIDTRSNTLADIGDELAGSKQLDRGVTWVSNKFTRLTGMATWNSTIKALTSALEQDALLRASQKLATGDLSKIELAKFAQNGIDAGMLKRIASQFATHGDASEGLARARTSLWEDREAAALVESSVVKSGNIMSIRRGVGDLPLFMNSEMARMILQFKTFGMAAVNRIMIPVAQGVAHGDVAAMNGFAMMLALGGMTYVTKEFAAGRQPNLTPTRVIAESLNWSGVLGYLPDVADPATGLLPPPLRGMRFSRYSDREPIQTLLGPTLGTATQAYKTIAGITDLGVTQQDLHALRQMVPLQNVFYLRRIINGLEGETGEAFGAQGATHETLAQRILKTAPPEKPTH